MFFLRSQSLRQTCKRRIIIDLTWRLDRLILTRSRAHKSHRQSYVLAAPELHFLGERLRESQTSGYLEGYRTRTLNSSKVPGKGRVRGLKALIDDGHARVVGADDKDDFDEDDVVASMVVAGTAEDETAGKSAQSEARGEYAVGGHAHMLDLDEDYGEEG